MESTKDYSKLKRKFKALREVSTNLSCTKFFTLGVSESA